MEWSFWALRVPSGPPSFVGGWFFLPFSSRGAIFGIFKMAVTFEDFGQIDADTHLGAVSTFIF